MMGICSGVVPACIATTAREKRGKVRCEPKKEREVGVRK